MASGEFDNRDSGILRLLQQDGRMSNQELAEKVGLSASVCWRRVNALEKAGIIERYAAVVDSAKAGWGFQAVVHVSLARQDSSHVEDFIHSIMAREEVLECLSTTGDADYHLKVICRDLDAYNSFLETFLFRIPGIAHVKTNVVLKEIKKASYIPV